MRNATDGPKQKTQGNVARKKWLKTQGSVEQMAT